MAEVCRMREGELLTEEKIESYIALLSDIDPAELEAGLRKAAQECIWFPTVAEIRERCRNLLLAAEQSWDLVQRVLYKHWHPDIGFYPNAPRLDAATHYAIRQAGGLTRIHDATDKQLSFIRQEFFAAYQRFIEEGGEQTRMSQQLAASTLKSLQAARPSLPQTGENSAAPKPTPLTHSEPRTWTKEDHEARMQLLRDQAEKLKGKSA